MPRMELVRVEDKTPDQRAQYDRFPSNLSRALLLTDGRLAKALPEVANALRASGLDAKLREALILRVAALSGSAYERMQHLEQARKFGWSDAEIAAIEWGDLSTLPAQLAAVLPFVDECVATPHVSDRAFAQARAVLSPRALATVILLVGHYMTIARFAGTLEIELDAKPDPWAAEH